MMRAAELFLSVGWSRDVNASEDTKCGPSVVTQSLQSLTELARVCRQKIDLLEAGQSFNRGEILMEIVALRRELTHTGLQ